MGDIDYLKETNIWEMFGFSMIKHPKRYKIIALILFIVILRIFLSPWIALEERKVLAKESLEQVQGDMIKVHAKFEPVVKTLLAEESIVKDIDTYFNTIKQQSNEFENIQEQVLTLKQAFDDEKYKEVVDRLSLNKKKRITAFSPQIERISNTLDKVNQEVLEISQLNQHLLDVETKISQYKNSYNQILNEKQSQLKNIQKNAKEPRISEEADSLFNKLQEYANQFIADSKSITLYTAADQKKYNLEEMRVFNNNENALIELYTKASESLSNFNNYWDILNTQYYTTVVKHSSSRSTDYLTEDNPAYREWTETETYTETESYTEKVYVGSRIVNDKKEDIYETVTKTRPVTKTRQVTKNNGKPKTQRVAYSVYSYYYTLEKKVPGKTTREERLSGEKHEKYDANIKSWEYDPEEEIGYTVWKQLWTDGEGIKRGRNLKPVLE